MYGVGYYGGDKLIRDKKKKNIEKRMKKTRTFFVKYSDFSIFLGRLIPFTRTYISLISGICKKEYYRYVFYSFFGIFIWNFVLISLGFSLFINLDMIIKFSGDYKMLILLFFSVTIVMLFRRFIKNKKR